METLKNAKTALAAANKNLTDFLNALVDDKSFVETDAFICSLNDANVGDGVVSGFAAVDDTPVCIFAVNGKTMKGAIGEANSKKIVRTINNAVRMGKPLIAVWDTMGARFAEGIGALEGYGSILRAYTVAYGDVPVITVIKGNNLGISSYVAGISDFVIAYDDSVIASASPLVIAGKAGVDAKTVGTAKAAAQKGIVTQTVKTDKELRQQVIASLAVFRGEKQSGDDVNRVCKGLKAGVGIDTLIKEVFDKNSFLELREQYAPTVKTGFATLADITVGVVAAADGERITHDACIKISEFLNVCENAERPVVFLVDSVGTEQSAADAALIREMSNLIYQVNSLSVDIFSVVYGKAIGGAYTALVAPSEYKIAWDSAEIGALESEAAARLLYADEIKSAKDKDKTAEKLAKSYGGENCAALVVAKDGYLDNVIEPNHTRSYLIAALLAHVE
ncbi:MAG: hypothetical protein K2K13_00475 [Clostridiales bacterium]|nr:hypothetical protein [Clostridiales bacterium]